MFLYVSPGAQWAELDSGIDMYFKVDIRPKSFPPFIVFTPPQVLELKFNAEHLKRALNYQAF